MKELHDMGVSYDEAFEGFQATIEDGKRQWVARLLREYPEKQLLAQVAASVRFNLEADAVEINSHGSDQQVTVAQVPGALRAMEHPNSIPLSSSLCVMTVGLGEPVSVSDVAGDPFMDGHPAQDFGVRSWASAPITIEGCVAGTVCAIEVAESRDWSVSDQAILESAAKAISSMVEAWIPTMPKAPFLPPDDSDDRQKSPRWSRLKARFKKT